MHIHAFFLRYALATSPLCISTCDHAWSLSLCILCTLSMHEASALHHPFHSTHATHSSHATHTSAHATHTSAHATHTSAHAVVVVVVAAFVFLFLGNLGD